LGFVPILALALLAAASQARAADADLIAALKSGGYVIVMRHAHSPMTLPAKGEADPQNTTGERQLDAEGKAQAEALGKGIKAHGVPIGPVYSSPTYRALLTLRLMGLPGATPQAELGEGGASMSAAASGPAGAAWLKAKVAEAPPRGSNTLLVTHVPNLTNAFGDQAKGVGDAEAMVFRPDGRGGTELAGRIKPEAWGAP
jgi:phosphohistidine phosphatase SixA